MLLAYTPYVQIGNSDATILGIGFDRVSDFFDDRMVHFPVQQYFPGAPKEIFCPCANQYGTDNSHRQVEPGPAVQPSANQRDNGQHRGGSIGDYVDIG